MPARTIKSYIAISLCLAMGPVLRTCIASPASRQEVPQKRQTAMSENASGAPIVTEQPLGARSGQAPLNGPRGSATAHVAC
jgi:hypothetical protein